MSGYAHKTLWQLDTNTAKLTVAVLLLLNDLFQML
jgi:hypothetical protein